MGQTALSCFMGRVSQIVCQILLYLCFMWASWPICVQYLCFMWTSHNLIKSSAMICVFYKANRKLTKVRFVGLFSNHHLIDFYSKIQVFYRAFASQSLLTRDRVVWVCIAHLCFCFQILIVSTPITNYNLLCFSWASIGFWRIIPCSLAIGNCRFFNACWEISGRCQEIWNQAAKRNYYEP
jgi:hypothetical protein